METTKIIDSLDRFSKILPVIIEGTAEGDARWKPSPEDWSILEIVCHLGDEEVDDFRKRVQLTLTKPGEPWPPIDPEAAAVERKYAEQDLAEATKRFLAERQVSLTWLRSLDNPDWNVAYDHPNHGPVHAGEVMASWAAHDTLHLRQITKRIYEMNCRDGQPYIIDYAGDW